MVFSLHHRDILGALSRRSQSILTVFSQQTAKIETEQNNMRKKTKETNDLVVLGEVYKVNNGKKKYDDMICNLSTVAITYH